MRYLHPESPAHLLRAYFSGDEYFESELEHLSGPDGCAAGCPACADEAAVRPGDRRSLELGATCNMLLAHAAAIEAESQLSPEKVVMAVAIRTVVKGFAEFEDLQIEKQAADDVMSERLAAVYMRRDDGDWNCQCVYDTENRVYDDVLSQSSGAGNAAEELVAFLTAQGETAKVVLFNDWSEVVDILIDDESSSE
jgi:hypothetical protein